MQGEADTEATGPRGEKGRESSSAVALCICYLLLRNKLTRTVTYDDRHLSHSFCRPEVWE